MTIMEFGKMPDDDGEPVGLVVRKKQDGTYKFILSDGDDDDLNDVLVGLSVELEEDSNDVTILKTAQEARMTAKGLELNKIVRAKRGIPDDPPDGPPN